MAEQHERRPDGQLLDDVSSYPITAQDRAMYDDAQQALSQLSVPTLYHKNNPHERLFIANFDGTGNDANVCRGIH